MKSAIYAAVFACTYSCGGAADEANARLTLQPDYKNIVGVWYGPDGKTLATLSYGELARPNPLAAKDYAIQLYNAADGTLRKTVVLGETVGRAVAFSRDGRLLAIGGRSIRLLDVNTGDQIGEMSADRYWTTELAFSPDSLTLASVADGSVKLWDVARRSLRKTIELPAGRAAFSPDGASLAIQSAGQLVVWDVRENRERYRVPGFGPFAFSPDGRLLAAVGPSPRNNTIALADAATGTTSARLVGHIESIEQLAFSPDGKLLVSGGNDGARVWNVITGIEQFALNRDLDRYFRALAFSRDGRAITVETLYRLFIIDAATGAELAAIPHHVSSMTPAKMMDMLRTGQREHHSPALSPDGKSVAWAVTSRPPPGPSGKSDASPARPRSAVEVWDLPAVKAGARLTDAQPLQTRPAQQPATKKRNILAVWPPPGFGKPPPAGAAPLVQTIHVPVTKLVDQINGLAISPDGRLLATRNKGGTVTLWEIATGRRRASFDTQPYRNQLLAFVAGGEVLAADATMSIHLWDIATGRDRAGIPMATYPDGRILVSPDSRLLAIEESGVRLFDAATAREKGFIGKGSPIVAAPLALSADGGVLAWKRYNEPPRLWDVGGGRELAALKTDDDMAALSPDGRTVATWSFRGLAIHLWDVATGRERVRLVGHESQVLMALFSADGKSVVSCEFGRVIAWDAADGTELGRREVDPKNGLLTGPEILRDLAAGGLLGRLPEAWDKPPGFFQPRPNVTAATYIVGAKASLAARAIDNGTIEFWNLAAPAAPAK